MEITSPFIFPGGVWAQGSLLAVLLRESEGTEGVHRRGSAQHWSRGICLPSFCGTRWPPQTHNDLMALLEPCVGLVMQINSFQGLPWHLEMKHNTVGTRIWWCWRCFKASALTENFALKRVGETVGKAKKYPKSTKPRKCDHPIKYQFAETLP